MCDHASLGAEGRWTGPQIRSEMEPGIVCCPLSSTVEGARKSWRDLRPKISHVIRRLACLLVWLRHSIAQVPWTVSIRNLAELN
jgi:hypothetical protein